ncbi:MAG: hypothetical protein KJ726_01670 [Verrucomicrobia bacterium]|nr:hypothetical protein [Verrucomicrobiota bacterium]MBU1908738.1 hypothetical protein [Verrucomicrobiota bacterium]
MSKIGRWRRFPGPVLALKNSGREEDARGHVGMLQNIVAIAIALLENRVK